MSQDGFKLGQWVTSMVELFVKKYPLVTFPTSSVIFTLQSKYAKRHGS